MKRPSTKALRDKARADRIAVALSAHLDKLCKDGNEKAIKQKEDKAK